MSAKKRVLYLSYEGLTDHLGQSQILPYVVGLADQGFDMTVFSFDKPHRFAKEGNATEAFCKTHGIYWISKPYSKNPPIFSTLKDLRKLENEILEIHARTPFDLIHCRSYLTALIGLRLKRLKQIPFIFDMRGFYADERVDGKIWDLENPLYKTIYKYFKKKEKTFLEEAAAVVSLTHAGKEEIQNWFNNDPLFGGGEYTYNYDRAAKVAKKTEVIPCATDLEHFDFQKVSDTKRRWLAAVHGIEPDREYLGYVGSLGTWYMGKEMIDLYKVLLDANPNLRFLILSQDDLSSLREYAQTKGIPRSYLVQVEAERKEVPVIISLMTASVFFILPAYSKKGSSPTKQGELMAMGVPVICNAGVGDSADIVDQYHAGVVINSFTLESYKMIRDKWSDLIAKSPAQIRKGAEEYFSLNKSLDQYDQIYKSVLSL